MTGAGPTAFPGPNNGKTESRGGRISRRMAYFAAAKRFYYVRIENYTGKGH